MDHLIAQPSTAAPALLRVEHIHQKSAHPIVLKILKRFLSRSFLVMIYLPRVSLRCRQRQLWAESYPITGKVPDDHFMIGGSPAPPYCPIRRLASCSNGCSVCGLISRCLFRFEVFFCGPPCFPLLFPFGIQSPPVDFDLAIWQSFSRLIDDPNGTRLRTIIALFLVPLNSGANF